MRESPIHSAFVKYQVKRLSDPAPKMVKFPQKALLESEKQLPALQEASKEALDVIQEDSLGPGTQLPALQGSLKETLNTIQEDSLFLRTRLDDIHDEKSQLILEKLTALSEQLKLLHNTAGLTFHGFPRLSRKLRRRIWEYALWSPQIIGVDYTTYSDSGKTGRPSMAVTPTAPHSSLLRVNKESRSIARQVLKPYHKPIRGVPVVFTNLEYDTIWFIDPAEDRECSEYYDTEKDRFEDGLELLFEPQRGSSSKPRALRKLAFSWNMFKKFAKTNKFFEDEFMNFIRDMVYAGVQEIYIVLEDNEAANKDDIVFKEPGQSPHAYINFWDKEYLELCNVGSDDGWNAFASGMKKWIQDIQDRHMRDWGEESKPC
jgi:hypothetical protein